MWRVACECCGRLRDCSMVGGFIACRVCAAKGLRGDAVHPRWAFEGLPVEELQSAERSGLSDA